MVNVEWALWHTFEEYFGGLRLRYSLDLFELSLGSIDRISSGSAAIRESFSRVGNGLDGIVASVNGKLDVSLAQTSDALTISVLDLFAKATCCSQSAGQ